MRHYTVEEDSRFFNEMARLAPKTAVIMIMTVISIAAILALVYQ